MKHKLFILISFLLLSGVVFGQEKMVDSLEIKRIDGITLNITNGVKNASFKKVKVKPSKIREDKSRQKIVAYLSGNDIVMITSVENTSSVYYYFEKGAMIYKSYSIYDNNHSSCGTLYVMGSQYFKDNELITSNETSQGHYPCPVILRQTIGFEEIYAYMKKQTKKSGQ